MYAILLFGLVFMTSCFRQGIRRMDRPSASDFVTSTPKRKSLSRSRSTSPSFPRQKHKKSEESKKNENLKHQPILALIKEFQHKI